MMNKQTYVRKKEHKLLLFLLSLIFLVIESVSLYLVYSDKFSPLTYVIIHALVSIVCLAVYFLFKKLDFDQRFPLMNLIFVIFLGPFGALLFMATTLLSSIFSRYVDPIEQTMDEFFPDDPEDNNAFKVYERIRFGLDVYDPEKIPFSYEEVMRYGTEAQKKTALERMLKYFRKEFTKPLVQALSDKTSSIRILAATAVARIDNQYSENLEKLEEEVLQNPNDIDLKFKYAKFLESLSELDLIDMDRREKLGEKAIAIFEALQEVFPEDKDIKLALGRLYLKANNAEKAITFLSDLKDRKGFIHDESLKLLLKALFQQKKYAEIRTLLRSSNFKVGGDTPNHDILIDEIMLWKKGIPKEKLYFRGHS